MDTVRLLQFRVVEKGQWCFIIWPWETPEQFLYEAYGVGCTYKLRAGIEKKEATWLEIVADEGPIHGEYSHNLFYGRLADQGWALYRRFNARGSHYVTQHGLDGVPRPLWDAAYEVDPGVSMGNVRFCFRVVTARSGIFVMSFYDWQRHFVSGQNDHISKMAICVTKREK